MKRLSSLMALVAFLSFGTMCTLAFAGEDKKDEHKDEGGHVGSRIDVGEPLRVYAQIIGNARDGVAPAKCKCHPSEAPT